MWLQKGQQTHHTWTTFQTVQVFKKLSKRLFFFFKYTLNSWNDLPTVLHCSTKRFEGLELLVSVWIVDGKTQKKQKFFKSQHRKNKMHIYCIKSVQNKTQNERSWINEMATVGKWTCFLVISHHFSLFSPLWLHRDHHHPQCLWSMCTMSWWNVRTKRKTN